MAKNNGMLGAQVYTPNGRDDGKEEPSRSTISGFGANMDTGRFTRYNSDGSQETHYNGTPAEQMFEQMGQVIQRGQAARQQKRQLDDAALASALVYSKQNNGFMPPDITNAISEQLGLPIQGKWRTDSAACHSQSRNAVPRPPEKRTRAVHAGGTVRRHEGEDEVD